MPFKVKANRKVYMRAWYLANKERCLALGKVRREANKPRDAAMQRLWRELNMERWKLGQMLRAAKRRAVKCDLPFTLTRGDISIPRVCPVFGIPLQSNNKMTSADDSPTLDRIDPRRGYVKGNVAVISMLANRLKNDGTAEQHRRIADWMESLGG